METDLKPVSGCAACDKAIATDQRVYTFQFEDGFGVSFDVGLARKLMIRRIAAWQEHNLIHGGSLRDAPLERLDPDQLAEWLSRCALDVSREHALQHIPPAAANTPGIIVDFGPESIPHRFRGALSTIDIPRQTMLIDGNHRAYRRLLADEPLAVYSLELSEQRLSFAGIMLGDVPVLTGNHPEVKR